MACLPFSNSFPANRKKKRKRWNISLGLTCTVLSKEKKTLSKDPGSVAVAESWLWTLFTVYDLHQAQANSRRRQTHQTLLACSLPVDSLTTLSQNCHGQILALLILAAKLPNSDLKLAVDFGVDFSSRFSRKKAPTNHQKRSPRKIHPAICSENNSPCPCPIWLDDRGAGQWKWLDEVPCRTSFAPFAFPCFVLCWIGMETEGLVDYQGRAGIISIVQRNLRPVIFGVDHRVLTRQFPVFGRQSCKARGRTNSEVQTVNWEGGGEGAVERGVKSSLKKAHKPWIRGKKGAQTVK